MHAQTVPGLTNEDIKACVHGEEVTISAETERESEQKMSLLRRSAEMAYWS